jgi:hypothetical protein
MSADALRPSSDQGAVLPFGFLGRRIAEHERKNGNDNREMRRMPR